MEGWRVVINHAGVLAFLSTRDLARLNAVTQRTLFAQTKIDDEAQDRAARVLLVDAGPSPTPAEAGMTPSSSFRSTAVLNSPSELPLRQGTGAQSWLEVLDEFEAWSCMREVCSRPALPGTRTIVACVQRLAALEIASRATFPHGSLFFRLAAVPTEARASIYQWRKGLVNWLWNIVARLRLAAPVASDAIVIADRCLLVLLSNATPIVAGELQLSYFASLCASARVHRTAVTLAELRSVSGATFYSDADIAAAEQRISRAFDPAIGLGNLTSRGAFENLLAPVDAAVVSGDKTPPPPPPISKRLATPVVPAPPPLPALHGASSTTGSTGLSSARSSISSSADDPRLSLETLQARVSVAVQTQPAPYIAALIEMLPQVWSQLISTRVDEAAFVCHVEPSLHRYHPCTRAVACILLSLRGFGLANHPTVLFWLTIVQRVLHIDYSVVREASDMIRSFSSQSSALARADPISPLGPAEIDALRPLIAARMSASALTSLQMAIASPRFVALARLLELHPRSSVDAAIADVLLRNSDTADTLLDLPFDDDATSEAPAVLRDESPVPLGFVTRAVWTRSERGSGTSAVQQFNAAGATVDTTDTILSMHVVQSPRTLSNIGGAATVNPQRSASDALGAAVLTSTSQLDEPFGRTLPQGLPPTDVVAPARFHSNSGPLPNTARLPMSPLRVQSTSGTLPATARINAPADLHSPSLFSVSTGSSPRSKVPHASAKDAATAIMVVESSRTLDPACLHYTADRAQVVTVTSDVKDIADNVGGRPDSKSNAGVRGANVAVLGAQTDIMSTTSLQVKAPAPASPARRQPCCCIS